MADTMQFDLVSPERKLASYTASQVEIPGAAGDLTAMPGHARMITTLRPGVLKVKGAEGEKDYVVTGGFAEINDESISILAEKALPLAETKVSDIEPFIEAAQAVASDATGGARDVAEKQLADLKALREMIG